MKTKPKKTVTAWAFYIQWRDGYSVPHAELTKKQAMVARGCCNYDGQVCGPIVKIALPLPKESKR